MRGCCRKRLCRTGALIVALFLLAGGRSTAAARSGDFLYGIDLNASLGYAIPTTDEYSNAVSYRLGAGYRLSELIAIDLSIGRFVAEVEHGLEPPPPDTIADGDLDIISAVLALQVRYPVAALLSTFTGFAGAGYYFIDYSWNDASRDYFRRVGELYARPVQDVSDSFGFNFGAGLEYPLSAQTAVNLTGQYIILKPDAEGAWRDLLTGVERRFSGELDLDTWTFSLGFRYFF